MNSLVFSIISLVLLTGCYISKEHRDWDNQDKNKLSDSHFYFTLKDTCSRTNATSIKMNYPYVCKRSDGYYKIYTFDLAKYVSSGPWVNSNFESSKHISNKSKIGYYKICGDTLTIEQIGSWTFMGIPWRYVHTKRLGIVSADTIRISKEQLDIKKKDKIVGPFDIYVAM